MKARDIQEAKRKAAKIIDIAAPAVEDFVKKRKSIQAEIERRRTKFDQTGEQRRNR
jgi:hypothetical protein